MKNSSLGSLIFLAGISLVGFIWFKRNKVTIGEEQLEKISKESAGINSIDKPFKYDEGFIQNSIKNPYSLQFLTDKEQAIINQNVKENIDCGSVLAFLSGTDCTNYNIRQQQEANPNNINTQGCNPPKLLITNVKRFNAGFPTPRDSGSLWSVFFNICGANIRELAPISWKIIIIDSIGSQEMSTEKQYFIFNDKSVGGNLPRRPKSAVITLSITDNKGKNYIQTFNYKE
jgi:hypothetical protein